ncbi:MAG: DUF2357 domain-containing protein [Lachnospiraceae bacterium]|nr:DUF2357 domain-containing protein [Lachnospiraceae bacterium]
MNEKYGEWYHQLQDALGNMQDNDIYDDMNRLVGAGNINISMNRKLMEKSIDVSWVEAIEDGLIHVDNVVRNPSRTIVDVEEVVPIALSKRITVESIKHLAQHTDLIQSVDEKRGTITPSKILNVHKEESLATYENRFVNTLIDRLYIFIMLRYEKLSEIEKDEEVFEMEMDNQIDDQRGNIFNVKISIDSKKNLESTNESGYTIWQRVEKLKKTIEGYKGSELCTTLGNNFVQPPIMRTNAIMKNVDLKACLSLWQYILSYDKAGYEINVEDTALDPNPAYIQDISNIMACDLMLFKSYTEGDKEDVIVPIGKKNYGGFKPKVIKRYKSELLSGSYDIHTDGAIGYIEAEGLNALANKDLPEDSDEIFVQIDKAIAIERNFMAEVERKRLEELALKEEIEKRRQERIQRLEEKRRIEEAKREERERARKAREEEKKRIQEMLERRRAEIEAEERERARLEAERKAKEEEERRQAEEAARLAAERAKLEEEKKNIRNEFGEAEGIDTEIIDSNKEMRDKANASGMVTADDIEEAEEKLKENAELNGELPKEVMEDPREVAVRIKLEQQKLEKERKEKERAQRLKAERKRLEAKPFREIYKMYTYNPIYAIPRFFVWLMYVLFGYIPKDTENPDQRRILAQREEEARREEYERGEREKYEVYYKKYSSAFPYNVVRFINDLKFKRKRAKANKGKPKPVFNPPNRTPQEQKAIDMQMKRLYKTYRVSMVEKTRRLVKKIKGKEDEWQDNAA